MNPESNDNVVAAESNETPVETTQPDTDTATDEAAA